MRRTRILLVGFKGMLGEIIAGVLGECSDMEIVGSVKEPEPFPQIAESVQPEILLVGIPGDGLPRPYSAWLDDHPGVKVLALGSDGRHLSELRVDAGGASLEGVIRRIRAALSAENHPESE